MAVFAVILILVFSACAEEAYYVVTNKTNVNMRAAPETQSHLIMQIKTKGTKLTVLSSVTDKKGNEWLQVESQLVKKGYIQASFLTRTAGKPVIKNSRDMPHGQMPTTILSSGENTGTGKGRTFMKAFGKSLEIHHTSDCMTLTETAFLSCWPAEMSRWPQTATISLHLKMV